MNEVICFHCHAWFLENSHSHNSGNSFNFLHRANVIVTISSSSRIMYLLLWAFYLFLPASHKLETAWSSSPSSLDWSQLQSHMKESEDIISTFYIPIITGNLFFVFWCLVLLYCLLAEVHWKAGQRLLSLEWLRTCRRLAISICS